MGFNLSDKDLTLLLAAINQKLADTEDPQFGKSVRSVASFAKKLIMSILIGVADNREDALEGARSAFADCEIMINKAYDLIDAFVAASEGKVH